MKSEGEQPCEGSPTPQARAGLIKAGTSEFDREGVSWFQQPLACGWLLVMRLVQVCAESGKHRFTIGLFLVCSHQFSWKLLL